nr:MAG TPA: hypothetical protein [Herelleviridae sp.]
MLGGYKPQGAPAPIHPSSGSRIGAPLGDRTKALKRRFSSAPGWSREADWICCIA